MAHWKRWSRNGSNVCSEDFVVKQNKFNNNSIIKKTNCFQDLGNYAYNTNVFWHRPQSYYDKDKWKAWEFDMALMNASH